MTSTDRPIVWTGCVLFLLCLVSWAVALWVAPGDQHQGEVYRIMYLHVPVAISAFVTAYVLLAASIAGLWRRSETSLFWGKASSEAGLALTVLTLATGSIWGYPTWGVWWTWDARITTTFLLALLFAGWLFLHESLNPGPGRVRICAALGVLIAVDVPVIYKSVTWWRTLHQPPSILREGKSTMAPEMLSILGLCFATTLLFSLWLIAMRAGNLNLRDKIQKLSHQLPVG